MNQFNESKRANLLFSVSLLLFSVAASYSIGGKADSQLPIQIHILDYTSQ
jgi:hypothetical protein